MEWVVTDVPDIGHPCFTQGNDGDTGFYVPEVRTDSPRNLLLLKQLEACVIPGNGHEPTYKDTDVLATLASTLYFEHAAGRDPRSLIGTTIHVRDYGA